MLIGEYQHSIDEKKRLALPVKFRKELGKKIIITRGLDDCLVVYPEREWLLVAERLSKLPANQTEARSFSRIILAGAMELALDKLGRILIPDYLKKYAGFKKNVIICGLSNKLEIWDKEKWEKYKTATEKKVGGLISKLGDLGM